MKIKVSELKEWLDTLGDSILDKVTISLDADGELVGMEFEGLDEWQKLYWQDETTGKDDDTDSN